MTKFSKWTEPAEILTAIGLIISLIFLIIELQEITAIAKTESYGASIERLNNWRIEIASNKDLAQLFTKYLNEGIDGLSDVELTQLTFLYGSLWSNYETAYFAKKYTTLGTSEWERYKYMICRQYKLTKSHNYWEEISMQLSPKFKKWVSNECN